MRPVPDQCKIFLSPAFIVGGQMAEALECGIRNAEVGMLLPIPIAQSKEWPRQKADKTLKPYVPWAMPYA